MVRRTTTSTHRPRRRMVETSLQLGINVLLRLPTVLGNSSSISRRRKADHGVGLHSVSTFHSRGSDRHPGHSDPREIWLLSQKALHLFGRDMPFYNIVTDRGCVTGGKVVWHSKFLLHGSQVHSILHVYRKSLIPEVGDPVAAAAARRTFVYRNRRCIHRRAGSPLDVDPESEDREEYAEAKGLRMCGPGGEVWHGDMGNDGQNTMDRQTRFRSPWFLFIANPFGECVSLIRTACSRTLPVDRCTFYA